MEQVIKLTGRIAKVLPAQSGTSQRTGEMWMSQEYVLEYFTWSGARFADKIVFRVFGEGKIREWNLKELEENVTVYLRFDAREYNGRYYNDVSATNVVREGQEQATRQNREAQEQAGTTGTAGQQQAGTTQGQQQAGTTQGQQQAQGTAQGHQQGTAQGQQAVIPEGTGDDDDLPF